MLGLDPIADNARLRPRIGVMLQGGGGYPAARAGEMLNLVASYAADPLDPQWLLSTLGLTDAARTTYRRLSGGQQQRLALACASIPAVGSSRNTSSGRPTKAQASASRCCRPPDSRR